MIKMSAALEGTMRTLKTLLGALLMLVGIAGSGYAATYSNADFAALTDDRPTDPTF